ncbi:hypothetical protein ASZ90_017344 [hydrocarbon metagenome]|uniref:HNH domain-containing protein n=1 Tax=hydrocarbon metagenome TaxID=938273 RepID=A0A0W8E9G0_9ZZZZ
METAKEDKIKYCEYCGNATESMAKHTHHIKSRGSRGKNVEFKENKIVLCAECHTKAHAGNIGRWELIVIVAEREGKTPEQICEIIGLMVDKFLPKDYVVNAPQSKFNGHSLDEVLQAYFSYVEITETTLWERAAILSGMLESGIKQKTLSSLVGCSPATIREQVRTYRAFPEETVRAQDMSFTVHRIASKTQEPQKWIDKACINGYSTRQLEEAIKFETGSEEMRKSAQLEKAERVIRMIKEIIESDDTEAQTIIIEEVNELLPSLKRAG